MKRSNEQWLPVVGWDNRYEVSNLGRVRSKSHDFTNSNGVTKRFRGRTLSAGPNGAGYPVVVLSANGERRNEYVHRLVLESFVGPCPDGMQACHNNGNPSDSRLENLRWDSPSSNMLDKQVHGTDYYASRTACKAGHEYTEENTRMWNGARICRTCSNDRVRRHTETQRANRPPKPPRTHCNRGHALDDKNAYRRPTGQIVCRECRRLAKNARRGRMRAAGQPIN